ncbi:cbb3-type cytochrome c oxidase subunit I [Pseudomonas aeruginosa]|uniref:cbb3-type cytochrome c oxidase subunit I n=15 Tax=Pseudomonas aeruginosa TaxID=287 RepID=UPI00157A8FF1|nr:cbb3-type cytochrome c oxidase subunit I [Pseudomonas aeruginosa]
MNKATTEPAYNYKVVRQFAIMTVVWGVIGMGLGVLIASQLVWPQMNFDLPWTSFGRLRPLHTNLVIFAFGGCALFATSYYTVQRTCQVRLFSDTLAAFTFWGWQAVAVILLVSLPLGNTTTKEYAEIEFTGAIWLAIVWVAYAVVFFGTLIKRKVKHIYVGNWFFGSFILTTAMLHIVNHMSLPVSWFKSYSMYSGATDAMVQWWYGHNAVGFFLTTGFLGMMYYFVPKQAGRPVYSYRLSIVHFWALITLYIWAGPHHLHYTALPDWAQSLGMVMSLILLAPSWGGMINGMMTLSGAWHKLRDDPILRFLVVSLAFYGMSTFEGPMMAIKTVNALSHYTDWTIGHVHAGALGWVAMRFLVVSLAFYGMSTFEGPMMAIKTVNALSHYTDWTIGHVHAGALGWVAMITIGSLYHLIPKVYGVEKMHSVGLINAHFWLATIGTVLYIASLWVNGITQGLMWRAVNEDGTLTYSFVESLVASHPGFIVRLVGGGFFLTGMLLMSYNTWRTVRQARPEGILAAARMA